MTSTPTNTFPYQSLIGMADKFIGRQIMSNRIRKYATIISAILGCGFLTYALIVFAPQKDLVAVAATLIALSTVFFGTIGFGLANPWLAGIEKLQYAEDIKSDLETLANAPTDENTKKFIDSFFELLRKLFT